jgi:hypothetical protein
MGKILATYPQLAQVHVAKSLGGSLTKHFLPPQLFPYGPSLRPAFAFGGSFLHNTWHDYSL